MFASLAEKCSKIGCSTIRKNLLPSTTPFPLRDDFKGVGGLVVTFPERVPIHLNKIY